MVPIIVRPEIVRPNHIKLFNTPGRRADRFNVRRSIGRRAEGGRRTTKGNGGRRTADREKFLLRFSNAA